MSGSIRLSVGVVGTVLLAGSAWFGWRAIAGMPSGGGFEIVKSTIDGGGGTSSGGTFEISGTIGQPDAGPVMSGGDFEVTGGFWPGGSTGPLGTGDCDNDGDVDLVDFGQFQICFTGSPGTLTPGCECADFDGDNDVDLVDFGNFQIAFTGS